MLFFGNCDKKLLQRHTKQTLNSEDILQALKDHAETLKTVNKLSKKRKLLAVRFVLSGKISILSNSLSVNKFFLSMKIIRKARNGYICFALYNTQSLCLVIWFFLNTRQFLITQLRPVSERLNKLPFLRGVLRATEIYDKRARKFISFGLTLNQTTYLFQQLR